MKVAGLDFVFCLFSLVSSGTGKSLLAGSPVPVSAVVGGDVVLPCRVRTPVDLSRVTLEWLRDDGPSSLTVHVLRNGEELEKEKAPEYGSRTAVAEDGSLKLLGVQRRDDGTYRCVLLDGPSVKQGAVVSLTVAQVSDVNFSVGRSPANQLTVVCESSGWSPEPLVSLLDAGSADVPDAQAKVSVRPDGLFSVRALINLTAAKQAGNRTLTCKVEIPGMNLANENKISISDEFDPLQTEPARDVILMFFLILLFVVLILVVGFIPVQEIEKLRRSVRRLRVFVIRLVDRDSEGQSDVSPAPLLKIVHRAGDDRYTEYGDIKLLETRGASEATADANRLPGTGPDVSNELAKRDLKEMWKYREDIISVGNSLGVHPALIAAIISRQSQAGTRLKQDGFGQFDHDSFGLMQINRRYHAVKGNPFSREHVDQGVTFLIQLIKTMQRTKPDWNKEQQLKGALACYIAGEDRIIPLTYEELDSVTPNGDFCSDVVARAHWFISKGF